MLINDLIEMLSRIPPMLAAGWGAWFFVGLLLSIWGRREKAFLIVHGSTKHKSGVRAAAAVKPPSGVRAPVKPSKAAAGGADDPFAELERLLEPESLAHRRPGEPESPALAESTPALAGPQSLP
jgi:hypothetical protein